MSDTPTIYEFSIAFALGSAILAGILTAIIYAFAQAIQHISKTWVIAFCILWIVSIGIVWRFRGYEVVPRE